MIRFVVDDVADCDRYLLVIEAARQSANHRLRRRLEDAGSLAASLHQSFVERNESASVLLLRSRNVWLTQWGPERDSATYELLAGDPLTLRHHGTPFELANEPVDLEIPEVPSLPRSKQPPGREPAARNAAMARAV